MKKTILLFIICILICSTSFASELISGTFNYMPAFKDMAEEKFFYTDDYFSGDIEDEHFITMSLNVALSTFEIENDTYVSKLYSDIGLEDIETQDMKEIPTIDTIGTAIAHKTIGEKNLVVVAIRGEKYGAEWASNFIVGKEGNAKGFDDASKIVIDRVKEYIQNKGLDNTIIWMCGYSRAGAVADLVGIYMNTHTSEFNTTANDLFVFTFETPACSTNKTIYNNILVFRNVNDMIPFVYPEEWEFYTNGKVITIGEPETIMTYVGLTEVSEYEEVNLNEFLTDFFSWFTGRISREEYADKLEEPISNILELIFSKTDEERTTLLKFVTEDVMDLALNEENKTAFAMRAVDLFNHNSDYLYENFFSYFVGFIDEAKENSTKDIPLTDEEYESFKENLYLILRNLGPIIVDDDRYYPGIDYDYYWETFHPEYYMDDAVMGERDGTSAGESMGYDSGFYGEEKVAEIPEWCLGDFEIYGQVYEESFRRAYTESFNDAYDFGAYHRSHLNEKGIYDGAESGKNYGFDNGKNGEGNAKPYEFIYYIEDWNSGDYILRDDYLEDWMISGDNEEDYYITNYISSFIEAFYKGEEEGKNDTSEYVEEPFDQILELYHVMTLAKNASNIISIHYPQNTLKLIQDNDSYYSTNGGEKKKKPAAQPASDTSKDDKDTIWSKVDDWALDEMEKAAKQNLIPDTFKGKNFTKEISRADFVAVAVNLYEVLTGKKAETTTNNPFTDTDDEYVLKAYNLGITVGVSKEEFGNGLITREQMATMISRALKAAGAKDVLDTFDKFADDEDISEWAKESVYLMVQQSIIKGIGDNTFDPLGNAKIEEALAIALRCVEVYKK